MSDDRKEKSKLLNLHVSSANESNPENVQILTRDMKTLKIERNIALRANLIRQMLEDQSELN